MFDPISVATGAALLAAGWLAARIGRGRPTPKTAAPTCSCGHPLAVHDRSSSECHAEIERPHYRKDGVRIGFEYVACPCRRYDGPEPIAEMWLPPTTNPRNT